MMAAARVATAYTGGSGLAEAVRRFGDEAHAEVVAVTLDLGQGKALEAVRDRALSAGAARAHVLDVRDEFARGFLLPALRAGALHRDGRSRAPALRRALAAAKLVEIARIEQAAFLAHGWAGDDGAAFERTVRAIDPRIGILRAPGLLDPSAEEHAPVRTAREAAGGEAARVDIRFRRGVPDALNAIEMSIADLVGSLGTIAAAHGGTPDQAPAVAAHLALQQAQTAVRRLGAEPEVDRFTDTVSRQYADLIDAGLWFSPLRRALDAFVDAVQDTASGLVHLRLFRGQVESAADRLPADPLAVVSVKG